MKALRPTTNYTEVHNMDARMFNKRGYKKYHRGNLEGAIRDFDEALRLFPNYSTAYHNRGFTKLKLSEEIQDVYGLILSDGLRDLQTSSRFPAGEGDYAI